MQIKNIKKGKNGFYKIEGDKKIVLADDIILKHNILYKKEIDDELIDELTKENYKYDVLNKVIKYISTKMRSKKEINKFLQKYELNKSDNLFIINKLTDLSLINDQAFAKAYIYDRMNLYHDGPHKIKKDLLNHKIDMDIICHELDLINKDDVYAKLERQIVKKISHNTKYPKGEFKRKIEHEFINLGYDIDMIDEIFDNNFVSLNEEELIQKEYQKIYQKYNIKYDKNKLVSIIKQKLYQKGYSIDDINNVVNKNL